MGTKRRTQEGRIADRDRLLKEVQERPGVATSMAVYETVKPYLPPVTGHVVARSSYGTGANLPAR